MQGLRLPLTELPRPEAWRHLGRYELRGDSANTPFLHLAELAPRMVDLTGRDLVKALVNLDLDDEAQVLAFVNELGVTDVSVLGYRALGVRPEDLPATHWVRRFLPLPRRVQKMRRALEVIYQRNELLGEPLATLLDEKLPEFAASPFGPVDEYGWEFGLGIATLQALVACHQELSSSRFQHHRLVSRWPSLAPAFDPPQTRTEAEERVEAWLRRGLSGLSLTMSEDRIPALIPPGTLYSLLTLELLNHMTSGRPLLVCANERCGKTFAHQEATSRYGGHRSDLVKYCTESCAQAQMQREYRRKLKTRPPKKGDGDAEG